MLCSRLGMRIYYCVILVALAGLCAWYLLFGLGKTPVEWRVKDSTDLVRCSERRELVAMEPEVEDLPVKSISLVENIVCDDDKLSCRMWQPYEKVAQIALEKFLEKPRTYRPKFIFHNEAPAERDPFQPAKKVHDAMSVGSIISVGYAWSTSAAIAADEAERIGMPYISPTSVVKRVHEGPYSISLGVHVEKAAEKMEGILTATGRKRILILECAQHLHEREYSESVSKRYPDSRVLRFYDTYPLEEIVKDLKEHPDTIIFVPGYTSEKSLIRKIHFAVDRTAVFVVGPQWTYDQAILADEFRDIFDLQIWSISDFCEYDSDSAKEIHSKWHRYGGEECGNFKFALYDAVMTALEALDHPEVIFKEDVMTRLNHLGKVHGLSRGKLEINGGQAIKPLFLMKWKLANFEEYENAHT